jgi:hypothetical protein
MMQRRIESKVTKPSAPARVEHDIPAYLASDEALIHILNRYPAELLDISRYDFGQNGRVSLTPGQRGHAAGETVLDAVKNGQLCITLNGIERAHPGLWAEIRMACADFGSPLEGVKARRLTGQLVISSSTARFPCRFDASNVVVFQLRGFQRFWIYPTDESHLPQIEVEKTVTGQASGELAHNRVEDNAAWRFGVIPGEALAWPLHAPHYIENEDGLCVSVIVTYETAASRATNDIHTANSVLRRWGREIPEMQKIPFLSRVLLRIAAAAFTGLGLALRNAKPAPRVPDIARAAIEQAWQIDRRSLAA